MYIKLVPFEAKCSRTSEPRVRVHPRGVFTLNEPAYEALGKPQRVLFLYDRASRVIGMKAAPLRGAWEAYAVGKPHRSHGGEVRALAFLKYNNITLTASISLPARLVDGVLAFRLPSADTRPEETDAAA